MYIDCFCTVLPQLREDEQEAAKMLPLTRFIVYAVIYQT